MQLIKLSSNIPSFKTVYFRTNTLNIVTGSKNNTWTTSSQKTFNWVWKSLLLNIINFCLGSSKYTSFEKNLQWWEFTLDFQIWSKKYQATRRTDDQNKIILNNKLMSRIQYCKLLEEELFLIPEWISRLSFRSLIKRFMRVEKESSREWNIFSKEQPYDKLLNTWFLLGLDVDLIQNKKILKNKLDEINDSRKKLEKDDIFRKFFLWDEDINIQISDYEYHINKLEKDLEEFKIDENYQDIENEMLTLQLKRKKLSRDIVLIKNQLKSIEESLNIKANLSFESVISVYENLKIILPSLIKKEIEDIEIFHKEITEVRQVRLLNSKYKLNQELKVLESNINSIWNKIDKNTRLLSGYWALEEYNVLTKKLNEDKNSLKKLQSYQEILTVYKKNITKLKIEIQNQNELAINYLANNEVLLRKINNIFRDLSKQFYPKSKSGISINENSWENTTQFEIEAKIEFDTSDGIWEIKFFVLIWPCYY